MRRIKAFAAYFLLALAATGISIMAVHEYSRCSMLKNLQSNDASVRSMAVRQARESANAATVARALAANLASEGPDDDKALRAAREIGSPLVAPLTDILLAPMSKGILFSRKTRAERMIGATRGLGAVGDPSAVCALTGAARAVHQIYDAELRERLSQELEDAVVSLGRDAVPGMLEQIRTRSLSTPPQLEITVAALARLASDGITEDLIAGLRDERTALWCGVALYGNAGNDSVPALSAILLESSEPRYDVAVILLSLDEDTATEAVDEFATRHKAAIDEGLSSYASLVGDGRAKYTFLKFLLLRYGTLEMAQACYKSGSPSLRNDAINWAGRNGFSEDSLGTGTPAN